MKDVKGVILTDVDGVLLDWTSAFFHHMTEQGLTPATKTSVYDMAKKFGQEKHKMQQIVRQFNATARIGY